MNRAEKRRELRNIEAWIRAQLKQGRSMGDIKNMMKTIKLKDEDGVLLGEKTV